MSVLDGRALGDRHAERRAQHVRLHVVGGEAVAGEQHVDPAVAHQPSDVGRSAGVHDRRAADRQQLAAVVLRGTDALHDLLDEQRLRLLRRHVGVHELEVAHVARPRRRVHPDAVEADDDLVAGLHSVHRHRAHRGVGHDDAAVHLRVLDGAPVAVDAHVGGEVGRRVEACGQHAVAVAGDERGVAVGRAVDAVHLQLLEQRVERGVVASR